MADSDNDNAERPEDADAEHGSDARRGDGTRPAGAQPDPHAPSGDESSREARSGDAPSGDEASGSEPSGSEPSGSEPSGDEPSGDELEPQSAFDALPEPAEEPAPDYDAWPYTDRRRIVDELPPDRSLEPPDAEPDDESPGEGRRGGDMGFFDHLEELRSRIIKALLGLVVGAIIAAIYSDFIIGTVLLGPAQRVGVKLQNTQPMGQLTLTLQVAMISGLIIAIPWIIWQFWQFVKPGLYPKERRYSSWIAFATIVCFLTGVAFAYFVMIPTSLQFAQGFVYGPIVNIWAISEYFSFVLGFILACGVVFEMPMLSFALARFGILTPPFMRHYRRHAAIVILIVAAIITPTPDPFNQLILAVPLYGLFEISILVSAVAARKRDEAYAETFGEEDIENTSDDQ